MELEQPYCEVCGESHATVATQECGMCDACFEAATRAAMADLMGPICGSVSINPHNGFLQVCLAPNGAEHDH